MDSTGLSQNEAEKQLKIFGLNEIEKKKQISDWQLVLEQVKSPLIYVLLGAMVVTGPVLKDIEDTILIGLAVVFNTILGFFQEKKASRALQALAAVLGPRAKVKRKGEWQEIEASQVVPGDVVRLELGSKIAADGVVIKADSLAVNESILTGESVVVVKKMKEKVFMGTIVAGGIGEMRVENTGEKTEFGKIASSLEETKETETPLQQQIGRVARVMTFIVLGVCLIVVGVGIGTGLGWKEIFPIAVALAVASIPEGLAVALTVILAIGMQRMLKRKALTRKLVAAETLGGVTVICCDKTGTLTEGKMKVVKAISRNESELKLAARLCNDMRDPLEVAMMEWALHSQGKLGKEYMRLDEIPFDPKHKFIATLHSIPGEANLLFVSGAPEVILSRCKGVDQADELKKIETEASKGFRLVGFAVKNKVEGEKIKENEIENLTWLGVLVYDDPVRKGVREVIEKAKAAGITIKVITGDYLATAEAVMRKLGIEGEGIDGTVLENLSESELKQQIGRVVLFARTKPDQKLRIVETLQNLGEVVAMLGDGVNDAPALKKADVGVVVNEASDVSKETADMILLDSNLGTILAAVAEGRLIRDNLKKVIIYLMADAFAEILIVLMSLIVGTPLAVSAGMILWINLISDGFPNLALTVEPAEGDLLKNKPERRKNWLIDGQVSWLIGLISLTSAITAFGAFWYYWHNPSFGLDHARSVAFTLLGLNSLVYVWSARSLSKPMWRVNWLQNKWLIVGVFTGIGLQILGLYSKAGQRLLNTVALNFSEWLVIGLGSLLMIVIVEGVKWGYNKKTQL